MTDQPSAGTSQPAGFYPDSTGTMRFWDGSQWTDHTQAPAAPVKKKHTVRNVLIGIFVLIALTFVGCTALLGSAVNEVDKAMKAEDAKDAEPGGPESPLKITEHMSDYERRRRGTLLRSTGARSWSGVS